MFYTFRFFIKFPLWKGIYYWQKNNWCHWTKIPRWSPRNLTVLIPWGTSCMDSEGKQVSKPLGTDHYSDFHLNLSLEKQKQDFNPEIIFLTNPWTGVDYPTGYDAAGEAWMLPSAMQLDNSGAQWPPSHRRALPMVPLPAVVFETP